MAAATRLSISERSCVVMRRIDSNPRSALGAGDGSFKLTLRSDTDLADRRPVGWIRDHRRRLRGSDGSANLGPVVLHDGTEPTVLSILHHADVLSSARPTRHGGFNAFLATSGLSAARHFHRGGLRQLHSQR
jgi:hypothetical protein